MQLFYRPGKAVLGDMIPFYDEGKWKPFYLKNTRGNDGPDCEGGWHMLTTEDHVHFTEHPTHIKGGTGSVLKVDEVYHMFYCTFLDNPRRQFIPARGEYGPGRLDAHRRRGAAGGWGDLRPC